MPEPTTVCGYPVHPACAALPSRPPEEVQSLAEDIKANGLRRPVVMHHGFVVDGRHRLLACDLAAIDPVLEEREFADEAAVIAYVWSEEVERRHLTTSQRAMVAARLRGLANLPSRADTAKTIGVSSRTVGHATRVLELGTPELVEAVDTGKVSVSAASNLACLEPEEQRAALATEDRRAAAKAASRTALTSSESNEHYTPSEYVDAARRAMGSIDLDPASCAEANATVRATRYLTIDDDGLSMPWHHPDLVREERGEWAPPKAWLSDESPWPNVWLNMPYGRDDDHRSNQRVWLEKLHAEYKARHIRSACVLVASSTGQKWFEQLAWRCDALCFVYGRIKFLTPDGGVGNQPTNGSVIAYLGPDVDAFLREFAPFGFVVDTEHARDRAIAAMTTEAA